MIPMNQDCIHDRIDRRMEPFYWILTFEAMVFLLLLATSLIVGPIYLIWCFQSWWTYILLPLLLLGAWLGKFSISYLRSAIRKNRLLNRYQLYDDRVKYRIHNHQSLAVREATILLEKVQKVYVSLYIAKNHYAYKKSKWREAQPYFHILPIIYVLYSDGSNNRVLQIPFYENVEAEIWLRELTNRGIPIWVTDWLLSELPEEEQLLKLADEQHSLPFSFTGNLTRELELMFQKMKHSEQESIGDGIEAEGAGEPKPGDDSANQPLLRKLKPKRSTLVIFSLLFIAISTFIPLADMGKVPADGTVLSLVIFLGAATVYMYLANDLTYWCPLRFILISIAGSLLIGINMPETDAGPGEEFFISALGVLIFMPAIVWIPYWIIYLLRRKREAQREA